MFALMMLFGLAVVAVIGFAAVALVAVLAKVILLPFRLLLLPLKLLALPFIAVAFLMKFVFLVTFGSIVVALLIPVAILGLVFAVPVAIVSALS